MNNLTYGTLDVRVKQINYIEINISFTWITLKNVRKVVFQEHKMTLVSVA